MSQNKAMHDCCNGCLVAVADECRGETELTTAAPQPTIVAGFDQGRSASTAAAAILATTAVLTREGTLDRTHHCCSGE